MKYKKITLSIILCSLSSSLFGETLYNLKNIEDMVVLQSPELRIQNNNIDSSQLDKELSSSKYLPEINFKANYSPYNTIALPVNGSFSTKETDSYNLSILLKQKVFDFGTTKYEIKSKENIMNIKKLSKEDIKKELILMTDILYEKIYFLKKSIDLSKENLKLSKELYEKAFSEYKNGKKTKLEMQSFLVKYNKDKDSLSISEITYQQAINDLNSYLNYSLKSDFVFENTLSTNDFTFIYKNNNFDKSPEISVIKENIKNLINKEKSIKGTYFGDISISGYLTHQNTINEYDTSYIGIDWNVPIYNGGITSKNIQKNKKEILNQLNLLNIKKRDLNKKIENYKLDLSKFNKLNLSIKDNIILNKENLKMAYTRWKNGLSSYIEVIEAQNSLEKNKFDFEENQYNIKLVLHNLEYLYGEK